MQAFWLNYDSGITFLDGAEASQYETIGPDQIIPLIAGQTEVNIINPNFMNVAITARVYGENGEISAPFAREIKSAGAYQSDVTAMFPSADLLQARYLRVRSGGAAIATSVLIRGFLVPGESAVLNGENTTTRTELNFPHVISGNLNGASYVTSISLTNLSTSAQTVTIVFSPQEGSALTSTRVLPGNGSLRESVQAIFGLSPEFRNGWIRVTGSAALTGAIAYADATAGALTVVPAGSAQTQFFFSHIANGPPQWQTGLALLNSGSAASDIEVYAMDGSGALLGISRFTLDSGVKIAKAIHELIPETRGVNGGLVFVRSTNNSPIAGIELFYTEDLKVLSNVAAARLVPGIIYTPSP
jgi:hypothetical protein